MRNRQVFGQIARHYGADIPIEILAGDLGFYIGTREDGLPFSRESEEYFATREQAQLALATGAWVQRAGTYAGAPARTGYFAVSGE